MAPGRLCRPSSLTIPGRLEGGSAGAQRPDFVVFRRLCRPPLTPASGVSGAKRPYALSLPSHCNATGALAEVRCAALSALSEGTEGRGHHGAEGGNHGDHGLRLRWSHAVWWVLTHWVPWHPGNRALIDDAEGVPDPRVTTRTAWVPAACGTGSGLVTARHASDTPRSASAGAEPVSKDGIAACVPDVLLPCGSRRRISRCPCHSAWCWCHRARLGPGASVRDSVHGAASPAPMAARARTRVGRCDRVRER